MSTFGADKFTTRSREAIEAAQLASTTGGHALALADETEQEVLRADVVVVEALRLVLGERQHLPCPVSELVEPFHRVERLFPCFACLRRWAILACRFARSGPSRRGRRRHV